MRADRRAGFTLATVLFALLLLSAVVTGAYVAALQSVRGGRLAQGEARARLAAGARIARALGAWDATWDSLSRGNALEQTFISGSIAETLAVRHVGANMFALSATARDTATQARRQLLAFARSDPLGMHPRSAIRVRQAPGAALPRAVDSSDTDPAGWSCPSFRDTVTTVTLQLLESDSNFFHFGTDWSWPRLLAWLGSLPAAGDSLPWRLETSDAVLTAERFTGVLVVNGDLVLRQTEVIGIVIVRGTLRLEWPGTAIIGTVVADAIELGPLTPPGSVRVSYSSCALHWAGRSRAPARALPGVPPAEVF